MHNSFMQCMGPRSRYINSNIKISISRFLINDTHEKGYTKSNEFDFNQSKAIKTGDHKRWIPRIYKAIAVSCI